MGLAAGAVLTTAAVGLSLLEKPATRQGLLTHTGREILDAVARSVLEGRLPTQPQILQRALDAHAQRFTETLRSLPSQAHAEVLQLLSVLAIAPGRLALTGMTSPWGEASVSQVSEALQRMRASGWIVRRQAYHALRDLTQAAHHVEEDTWAQMGYPGPRAMP
jgi:hypothetical protein